ncbi:hypothetical protein ACU42Y_06105 [Proteus mirabilis]
MGNPASAIVILSVCPKRAITLEIELLSNTPFSSLPPQRNVSLFYIVGNENRKTSWIYLYCEGDRNVSLKERKKEKSN